MNEPNALLESARAFQRSLVRAAVCHDRELTNEPGKHWYMYRRMMRARLFETIEHAFERVVARLGLIVFRELEAQFLATAPPADLILRFVPGEFLAFWQANATTSPFCDLPASALDLACFEWAELVAAYAPNERAQDVQPLAMESPVWVANHVQLVQVQHAVHRITRDEPCAELVQAETYLCLYRDATSYDVRTLELSGSAYAMLMYARTQATLAESVRLAATQTSEVVTATWLESFAALMADLMERQVVLGSRRYA
jgi:hypothetical protein